MNDFPTGSPEGLDTSSRQANVIVALVAMLTVASITVGLRMYTRVRVLTGLKADDWLVIIGWLFSIATTVGFIRQTYFTLGRHIWLVTEEDGTAGRFEEWYTFQFYGASLSFTKISILLLYRKIMPAGFWRVANYTLMGIITACNVWVVLVAGFIACIPLRAKWDFSVEGWCIDPITVGKANGSLNIVTDFAIFALPLPIFARLRMHWKRKAALCAIFALGFVVCIVSIVRIVSLGKLVRGDITYNLAIVAYWGAVEVNLPIICACLVTIKPLIAQWFPSLLGTSAATASAQYPTYSRTAPTGTRKRNKTKASFRMDDVEIGDLGRDDLAISGSAPTDSDERLIIQMNKGKGALQDARGQLDAEGPC